MKTKTTIQRNTTPLLHYSTIPAHCTCYFLLVTYRLNRYSFALSNAFARWLIRFFTSSPISANVMSKPSGTNTGSYPNPPWPQRTRAIVPGQSPRKTWLRFAPTTAMAQRKSARRSAAPANSPNSRPIRSSSVPPYRADSGPGAPLRKSTKSPESSARLVIAAASKHCRALNRAFSSISREFSSSSPVKPTSASVTSSKPPPRIETISRILPSFLVARASFKLKPENGPSYLGITIVSTTNAPRKPSWAALAFSWVASSRVMKSPMRTLKRLSSAST